MPLCRIHQALSNTCRFCQALPAPPPVAAPGPVCPECGYPQTSFCPACRGSKGGKVVTPAKVRSLRRVTRDRERNRKIRNRTQGGNET